MSADRILIFDADAAASRHLGKCLANRGVDVLTCSSSAEGARLFGRVSISATLICLERLGTGLDLLDHIRMTAPSHPIVIATYAPDVKLRIQGLERGASDYLIRPFDSDELLARWETARLRQQSSPAHIMRYGRLTLDVETGQLSDNLHQTCLSPTERQACALFFEHGDRMVPKQRFKNAMSLAGNHTDNSVEVVIYRLRAKARPLGMNIRTYRGSGYQLECA